MDPYYVRSILRMQAPLLIPDIAPPVSGHTLLFPVVGNPISQVKAPLVFNALFRRAGIDALVVPLDLPPATVLDTCRGLLASGSIGGLLVTVPYKKTLFDLVAQPGEPARLVGAVNAIRRDAGGAIAGDLFDGIGFVAGLRAAGHDPAGRKVLLVGAGGAGSAVAAALLSAGVVWLGLFDVHTARAEALASHLQACFADCTVVSLRTPSQADCDIAVNTTPLGMKPDDPLPLDPAALPAGTLVVDVIMQPAETPLLRHAAQRGLPVHPGRPMLDHQLPAYLDFFGLPQAAQLARATLRTNTTSPI
jgi:shikimate dehydrogenase